MTQTTTIQIKRYNPETEKVSLDEYKVPTKKDSTVLEAVKYINEKMEGSVSHRSSCNMGMCGSCGAIVNGKHVLMCSTFCKDLKKPILIEPLKNFKIIKDLVVDTDSAMDKVRKAIPYTNNKEPTAKKSQTPAQLKKTKQTSQCIKCMLCYSACPIYGFNKKFIGPAAAATAYRYNEDSRDTLKDKRMDSVTNKDGIYKCTYVGECSNVCPKNVDPSSAIQKLKTLGVTHSIKSIFKRPTNPRKK